MVIRWLISALCALILPFPSYAESAKSFVYWINGNGDFLGPTYEKGELLRLEDQAYMLYKNALQRAKEDHINNYLIVYDGVTIKRRYPHRKIKTRTISRDRSIIYIAGERVSSERYRRIDTNDVDLLSGLINHLGASDKEVWDTGEIHFYYYGEQLIPNGSHVGDQTNGNPTREDVFISNLETFNEIELLRMQSCFANNLFLINRLKHVVNNWSFSKDFVANTAPEFKDPDNDSAALPNKINTFKNAKFNEFLNYSKKDINSLLIQLDLKTINLKQFPSLGIETLKERFPSVIQSEHNQLLSIKLEDFTELSCLLTGQKPNINVLAIMHKEIGELRLTISK